MSKILGLFENSMAQLKGDPIKVIWAILIDVEKHGQQGAGPIFQNILEYITGMRKFRIDQDFLIEHWHMIFVMSVVFAEIYV